MMAGKKNNDKRSEAMSTFYPAHDGFVAPARDHPQIWRLIVGFLVAILIYVLLTMAVIATAMLLSAPDGFFSEITSWDGVGQSPMERELMALLSGQRPTQVLVILSTFGGMFLGAMAAAKWFHGRSFASLTGPLPIMVRHFGLAALVAAPLLALSMFLPPNLTTEANIQLGVWLTFLPMALLMILLQTGAEELLFRGYLQQQLAARFRSPIIWMVLPSVLFGLGHWNPDQFGTAAWTVVGVTTLVGLFAADLTARTGTIGAAWGFHFANNVAAILIISLEGPLSGLSLWLVPAASVLESTLQLALVRDILVISVIWFTIRQLIRP